VQEGIIAVAGGFARCVSRKRDPLSAEGARMHGGRFNPKGVPALYLAGSPAVAVAEALELATVFEIASFNPRLVVFLEVSLQSVLDLSQAGVVSKLGLGKDELLGDWRAGPEDAATQAIGLAARDDGVEAILYPSRLESGVLNLCVFRENMRANSVLSVHGMDDWLPHQ